MSLHHGWGSQPSQTASRIHIRHIHNVWAHWYVVHRHMVAALHSYTHPPWLRFWGSGSLVSRNDMIMSWLRLIATSNCFPPPHLTYTKCLSILICCPLVAAALHSLLTVIGSEVGVLGHCRYRFSWKAISTYMSLSLARLCGEWRLFGDLARIARN